MPSPEQRRRTHFDRAENRLGYKESRMSFDRLVEKSAKQAERIADSRPEVVEQFIANGYREQIINSSDQESTARTAAQESPDIVPDIIEDPTEQAAFLVALAHETSKPGFQQ